MILIIGSHQDDVLYCASLLNNRTTDMLFGRFPVQKGTIFNQEVMLVSGIHTGMLAASVTSSILGHNYVNLVFVLGKCFSVKNSFKKGDIVISRDIYNLDVDQIEVANATLGQVPGLPVAYHVQKDVIGYVGDGFHRRTHVNGLLATFLCSENLRGEAVKGAMEVDYVRGTQGPFVVDSVSYGVAMSCLLHDIPMISIKAVERDLKDKKSVDNYIAALDTYVDIGKAVVYTIGDIGRSDVLRARRQS